VTTLEAENDQVKNRYPFSGKHDLTPTSISRYSLTLNTTTTVVVLRTTVVELLSTESIIHDPHSAIEKATNRVELGARVMKLLASSANNYALAPVMLVIGYKT
jgi:hypothetical protein